MAQESAAAKEGNQETPSLFPIFNQPPTTPPSHNPTTNLEANSNVPQWLSNTSFTTDLSLINEAISSRSDRHADLQEEDNDSADGNVNRNEGRPVYQLVDSFASDNEDSEGGKKWKEKRKKRNRPYDYEYVPSSRKPDVRSWAKATASTSSPSSATKEYYSDSRGDRNNLAFKSRYRYTLPNFNSYTPNFPSLCEPS